MSEEARKIRLIMDLRRRGITDQRVLSAVERTPRDLFVPDLFSDQAFDDTALPIDCGQTISQPYVVAYMTQMLDVGDRMKVLEIGTGSGYQTAILAALSRRTYTIERYRSLMAEAEARFRQLKVPNITTRVADGLKGWPEQEPFDRIIVTAAAEELPLVVCNQMKIGGVMIMPIGKTNAEQKLIRIERNEEGFDVTDLIPVRFVPLVEGVAKDL